MQSGGRARQPLLLLPAAAVLLLLVCTAAGSPQSRTSLEPQQSSAQQSSADRGVRADDGEAPSDDDDAASSDVADGDGDDDDEEYYDDSTSDDNNRNNRQNKEKNKKRNKNRNTERNTKRNANRNANRDQKQSRWAQFTDSCECGLSPRSGEEGSSSPLIGGQQPWQAALISASNDSYVCGATVINEHFLLTAAHCVNQFKDEPEQVKVMLAGDEDGDYQEVEEIIVHKKFRFNEKKVSSDIALIKLKNNIEFSSRGSLAPVCLLSDTRDLFVGQSAAFSSFRGRQEGGTGARTALQETELKVLSNKECVSAGYDQSFVPNRVLCATELRAGGEAHLGDGGSPLARKQDGRYQLIGITSFMHTDGQKQMPAGFTRVTKYLSWIDKNTRSSTYCQGFSFRKERRNKEGQARVAPLT